MTQQAEEKDLWAHLQQGVVVGDGAMATLLHQSGVPVRACFEELCITMPNLIRSVHQLYLDAGATVIQTNTFSGHRAGLSRYGLADKVDDINKAAVRVARGAAGTRGFVLGTVGSTVDLGLSQLALGGNRQSLAYVYEEQTSALLEAKVDGFLLETFADLSEMMIAIETLRKSTTLPILANLSPDVAGVTRDGVALSDAFDAMKRAGADVVGLNCHLGLSGILRSYEGMTLRPDSVYAAVPNAGRLHLVEGEYEYTGSAAYFAEVMGQIADLGVTFLGGCCGTTPDHIRALTHALSAAAPHLSGPRERSLQPVDAFERPPIRVVPSSERETTPPSEIVPEDSLVRRVGNHLTVIVELDPPKTLDVTRYLEGARALRDAGADYLTLADNSLGTVRVSNMALASILKRMGIDPLVHVTCRDRNLIGQQSHLMGLHVLGIHHILLVTGDPSRFGDLPGATSVYDVSSIELTKMVKRLNAGVAFSGQNMKKPATFRVGTSFNPNVQHFEKAADRLKRKVEAGADYVLTQPVFDVSMFERMAALSDQLGVPMFVGIMPLVSARNAYFLHHEVPGIQIPNVLLQRMANAPESSAKQVGLSIAEELIEVALECFRGLYLVTPFLQYDTTVHLTQFARQFGQREVSASSSDTGAGAES